MTCLEVEFSYKLRSEHRCSMKRRYKAVVITLLLQKLILFNHFSSSDCLLYEGCNAENHHVRNSLALLVLSDNTCIVHNHGTYCFLISAFIWLILPKVISVDLDRISTCGFSVPRNYFLNLSFVNSDRWFFSIVAKFLLYTLFCKWR